VTDSAQGKYAEYEVACQWRIVGNDRIAKDRVFQWSVWKRFTEFDTFHKQIAKSLGWLMDGMQFPPAYTMTLNKYSAEFIERRRDELNTYWQAVVSIPKVAEFDKHHCSMELKQFLDVENAMLLNEQSGANTNALEKADEEAGPGRPAARRLSVKPASSRRLSTKQDSITNFSEDTSGVVTTTSSRPRPQSQRPGSSSNTSSPQPAKAPARPASTSSPPPAALPPSAPAPSGPPLSKLMQENLGKYNKMKSMLPEGAVRQRMCADGCSDAEIDAFFGADVAPPPVSSPAPAVAPAAAPKKAAPAPAAAPPPSGGGKAPAGVPPKTAGRSNLLADIAKRRIE
jgi:hypothetical protein